MDPLTKVLLIIGAAVGWPFLLAAAGYYGGRALRRRRVRRHRQALDLQDPYLRDRPRADEVVARAQRRGQL